MQGGLYKETQPNLCKELDNTTKILIILVFFSNMNYQSSKFGNLGSFQIPGIT